MLEILGTVVGSIFSGGATGIIGVIAQRFADYKNKQLDLQIQAQKFEQDVKMKEIDRDIMQAEYAAKLQITQVETAGATDVAEAQAFAESFKLEPQRYAAVALTPKQNWLMVLLDFCRGIVRPALTIYLCALVTIIYYLARDKVQGEDLTSDEALELLKLITGTILYVWTTCTLWWFGTRNKKQ